MLELAGIEPGMKVLEIGSGGTPLLSSRHPWRLHLTETPPTALPREYDVVRVSMGLGMSAIDQLVETGSAVGPLLCCNLTHRRLLVPVELGTAALWGPAHSVCDTGPSLRCSRQGAQSVCHHRFWVAPPEPQAQATTSPWTLHDCLSLVRAQMRNVNRHPMELRVREICHV